MKLLWMIIAGFCIVVAAFLMLRGDLNTAFVVAVLGVVAWFLNYRIQMKAIVTSADLEENKREEIEDGEDSDEN